MFSSGGVAPEIVISSKQKAGSNEFRRSLYRWRKFYFDAEKIARDGLLVRGWRTFEGQKTVCLWISI
jgi:hypothetical protein